MALLEQGHKGLRMGPRHVPLAAALMSGTVEGENVWIPMSSILGGQERCGFGWNTFVECLAEGRGVSLPAGSIGAARSLVAGAYARVRKQFRVPIAEFGRIQEGERYNIACRIICVELCISFKPLSLFEHTHNPQPWPRPAATASLPSQEATS